jgi:SAM-dependent methyltransferase
VAALPIGSQRAVILLRRLRMTDNPPMPKLSVLIPVYNEARTLRTIIARVLESDVDVELELVCVDDCSTDDSLAILNELAEADARIRVIAQPVNLGKGKAIRTAIEHMTGDLAIIQDADLEYDPNDYRRVLRPLLDGHADAVYGSRFAASEQRRVLFFWHALGNRLLTTMSNMANDLNLTDMETCYKAFRGDLLKSLRLTSDRFGFEPEVTARLAQWGATIYEVPISYHGRTYAEGKNIGWRDGIEALWLICKFRFLDSKATDDWSSVTRQSLGRAPRFRQWTLSRFAPFVGERVLEMNGGPGHLTSQLLDRNVLVVAESDPVHVETLQRRFGHLENLTVVQGGPSQVSSIRADFDTAFVFDDLQRVDEPKAFLADVAECLESNGHILIQVPAGPELFGPADEAAGHRRRFTRADLLETIRAAGLDPVWLEDFNRLGTWAWRLHHSLGKASIGSAEARSFDWIVPVARRLESAIGGQGLSLLAVARVP